MRISSGLLNMMLFGELLDLQVVSAMMCCVEEASFHLVTGLSYPHSPFYRSYQFRTNHLIKKLYWLLRIGLANFLHVTYNSLLRIL